MNRPVIEDPKEKVTDHLCRYDDFFNQVIERDIQETNFIEVRLGELFLNKHCVDDQNKCYEGNGEFEFEKDCLSGRFNGASGSYQARLKLPCKPVQANGISVCFRLQGWKSIRYLAIGYSKKKVFHHVKIKNPSQDEWVVFNIGLGDLANKLKNPELNLESDFISDLRVYVSAKPSENSARIDIAWVGLWLENLNSNYSGLVCNSESISRSTALLVDYFKSCNPNIDKQVLFYLDEGKFPLTDQKCLKWDHKNHLPDNIYESGTYQYVFHAMHLQIWLLVYFVDRGDTRSICAARDLINDWTSTYQSGEYFADKYVWYDHGVAERFLALLLAYCVGKDKGFDPRFMSKLSETIVRHGQLLESEVFYSSYQPTRYHNHAWFQDVALIAAQMLFPTSKLAERWAGRGIARLEDQLEKMIVRDKGFAIFVENSIGYHRGIQNLVNFAANLITNIGLKSPITNISLELGKWSEFFKYSDGRNPSQGDTFRKSNNHSKKAINYRSSDEAEIALLDKAGYGVVKGLHNNRPYMLSMLATSLCETHKHEDNLSFTLNYDGVEWLIDPSMYSHDYTNLIPKYLRSAEAHNNLVIEGIGYSLEPGLARLWGIPGRRYVINGEHFCYKDIKVERQILGDLHELNLEIKDAYNCEWEIEKRVYVVLHCGENVEANICDDKVFLTHRNSGYSLEINTNSQQVKIKFGQDGKSGKVLSVAGQGFEEFVDTYSVVIELGAEQTLEWSITAKPKNTECTSKV